MCYIQRRILPRNHPDRAVNQLKHGLGGIHGGERNIRMRETKIAVIFSLAKALLANHSGDIAFFLTLTSLKLI